MPIVNTIRPAERGWNRVWFGRPPVSAWLYCGNTPPPAGQPVVADPNDPLAHIRATPSRTTAPLFFWHIWSLDRTQLLACAAEGYRRYEDARVGGRRFLAKWEEHHQPTG